MNGFTILVCLLFLILFLWKTNAPLSKRNLILLMIGLVMIVVVMNYPFLAHFSL